MSNDHLHPIFQEICDKISKPSAPAVDPAPAIDVCIAGAPAVNGICGNPDCVCSPENPFGEVIFSYSRAQAIEEGVLIDLGTFSFRPSKTVLQEVGIKFPVAITSAAYAKAIGGVDEPLPPCQDLSGRMFDVVNMLSWAIRRGAGGDRLQYRVSVINWVYRQGARINATKREDVVLKAICGPGDDAEPVITIMLPDED
jgi:hypothetical protein